MGAARSEISSFTDQSRRRLRWAAANAYPALISQFGMTWHKRVPSGREVKAALNLFLSNLRHEYPDAGYLWILEFQTRGTAHVHLWLTLSVDTVGLRGWLARTWHRIAEPESAEHEMFHQRERNFVAWSMGDGWYLCKYVDKVAQKVIPAGFYGVGRFWGASRLLVPQPVELLMEDLAEPAAAVRTLCKHHEANNRRSRYRKNARRTKTSYRLPKSGPAAWALMGGENPPPFPAPYRDREQSNPQTSDQSGLAVDE